MLNNIKLKLSFVSKFWLSGYYFNFEGKWFAFETKPLWISLIDSSLDIFKNLMNGSNV